MTSGLTRICAAFCGVLLPLIWQPALAKPLSSEDCAKLVGEHAELSGRGIEKAMDREPANADQQMKPEEFADIERYLFIEGQIRFRCPGVRLAIPEPAEPPQEQAAKGEKREPKAPAGPPVPLPRRKPSPVAEKAD